MFFKIVLIYCNISHLFYVVYIPPLKIYSKEILITKYNASIILSRVWVLYRRVLDWWPDSLKLWYSAWLHFTVHYYTHTHTHTSVHSHVFTSRYLIAASNGGHYPYSGLPNFPRPQLPASHSNSSQRLNSAVPELTRSLTNQLKVKLSLQQAAKAHRVVRRRGSYILSRKSADRWR
jgi:hypothetical protein